MSDRLLMAMTVLVATLAVASAAVAFQPPEAPPGGGASVSAAQAPQLSAGRPSAGASPAVLGRIALGFLLTTIGATLIVVAAVFRGPGVLTLVVFGVFSLLYGVRILVAIPVIAQMLGLSRRTLFYMIASINYFLPAFGMLYANQIRGAGWFSLLRRSWQVGMALAAVFVAYDVYRGFAWASLPYYRVYLLIAMGILLPHVIWWQQRDPIESRVRMIGTALLTVAVIHDNVPEILPWSVSLEVYGVSAFILSLGYVTTRRFFADQRELAAVERELETARVIQTSILPRELPALEGLRIAVHYVPVRSVAGDVYDFLTIDDRRLAVLVADVAGHGVSAALIGSMTTVAFSSQKPHGHDPSRVLTEINRVLYGHFDARYVTAACLFVDLGCHRVRYSLAGHPPPLLWKARTRQVVALSEGGTVLGLFEDIAYPSTDVSIEPGDRLVLYTDGVSEVLNRSGEWFGDRALAAFVGANAQLPAASFVDALLAALARWSGREGPGAFDDDVTLVVIDV